MRVDRIHKYVRDLVLLVLPAYGFITEVQKDKPDLWLILLFFGLAASPGAFAMYALRQQGADTTASTPESPSQPPSQSPQQASSSS